MICWWVYNPRPWRALLNIDPTHYPLLYPDSSYTPTTCQVPTQWLLILSALLSLPQKLVQVSHQCGFDPYLEQSTKHTLCSGLSYGELASKIGASESRVIDSKSSYRQPIPAAALTIIAATSLHRSSQAYRLRVQWPRISSRNKRSGMSVAIPWIVWDSTNTVIVVAIAHRCPRYRWVIYECPVARKQEAKSSCTILSLHDLVNATVHSRKMCRINGV